MRKIFILLLILSIAFPMVSPVIAITVPQEKNTPSPVMQDPVEILYPEGADFEKLKSLIETNFSKIDGLRGGDCIAENTLCPNYKYTSIIEKAIKLIVLKTYVGNEAFYSSLFTSQHYQNSSWKDQIRDLPSVLGFIPRGSIVLDWRSLGFGKSIGGELLEKSFGLNFNENKNPNSMLGAIEEKINDLKRTQCQKVSRSNDCYSNNLSNTYLPTQEVLYKESIYFNRSSVQIGSLSDEIEYMVTFAPSIEPLPDTHISDKSEELNDTATGRYVGYVGGMVFRTEAITQKDALESCMRNLGSNAGTGVRCMWNDTQIYPFVDGDIGVSSRVNRLIPQSYTLRYKKDTYTLEEAKAVIENQKVSTGDFIVTSILVNRAIPCEATPSSQCSTAQVDLRNVQMALIAYFSNNATYPDTLDPIKGTYINNFPQDFDKYFSYKGTKNVNGKPDYEIKYIGHIGEGTTEASKKKDYIAMMSGAIVPEIPTIFAYIPADSMVLYIKNPSNLIDILSQNSSTSQLLSGIDVSEGIRTFMMTFFELEKFDQIEKNLKHEMAIVVNNMDATAPDIVMIISESDKDVLSPTAKARIVGSTGGYIFIANSQESLERCTGLAIEKSLKNAPDFQYIWWKKASLIEDAMMFVGDAFFEKMLTFETYLTHYRKYRDYARLSSLQELVWAYGDAFGVLSTGLDGLAPVGFHTLTGEVLNEYSMVNGLVIHQNIGTMKSIKTLPETKYDLSKVSKMEIEDYKYNVLKYRELWRVSLDPMGIVINRYGDGMEIDFFMTPIPSASDRDLQQIQRMFEGTTKESLSFVTNSQIRMGLLSFVVGFDPKKLESKIKATEEIGRDLESFNREVLDGKDIFDYLGGEFAWSLGSLDTDLFEGWNIDKVDAYISIQVANETKGKELIDLIKRKMLDEISGRASSTESAIINMLAKPLIEDYKGKKIYYVEGIPVPWVGKIGIAYTFVDDFFIVGINRLTIHRVIDTALSGDVQKKNIVSTKSLAHGTFFAALFDGVSSSQQIKKLYENKLLVFTRYIARMINKQANVTPVIASYYALQDRSQRLGKEGKDFNYMIGSISFSGIGDAITVKIDEKKMLSSLSGVLLEAWETIKNKEGFSMKLFTEKGIPLEEFLLQKDISEILTLNLQVQLNNAIEGSESLFRNVTFGMNMGDDEIGFRLQVFRQKNGSSLLTLPDASDMWMIGGIILLLMVVGGIVIMMIRHTKAANIPTSGPINSSVISTTVVETSKIVSLPIVPQVTNTLVSTPIETPSSQRVPIVTPSLVAPIPTSVEVIPGDTTLSKPIPSGAQDLTDTK